MGRASPQGLDPTQRKSYRVTQGIKEIGGENNDIFIKFSKKGFNQSLTNSK